MVVGRDAYIADDVKIKRPELVRIGNHVAIDDYFYCTTQLDIGNYVHISPFVSIIGGKLAKVSIGNFCTLSAGARLIGAGDDMNGQGLVGPLIPDDYRDDVNYTGIIIEDFVSIGTNAIVMPGVRIRQGAVVGAGAFVGRSLSEWSIYAGVQCNKIKDRPKEKMLELAKRLNESTHRHEGK